MLIESQEHHEVTAAQDDSEAELSQMKDQHSDLLREKARLEDANGTLRTAHDELSSALQANEKELDNLRLQLAESTTSLTESTRRVGTLESSTAALTAAQETLRAQLAKETKRAEGAQNSREALLVDNQGLMSQLEEMRERNGQVMKDLAELGEERDALTGTVDKLEVCSETGFRDRV
jgi:chromosome segregation ATPase